MFFFECFVLGCGCGVVEIDGYYVKFLVFKIVMLLFNIIFVGNMW